MKIKSLFLISLLSVFFSCEKRPIEEYSILPAPQSIGEYQQGVYKLGKNVTIAYNGDLKNEADFLQSKLNQKFSLESNIKADAQKGNIVLKIDDSKNSDKEGAYKLQVTSKGVEISSGNSAGIFYGIESALQIIKNENGKFYVQKGVIDDYPAFEWRAFMLDEGRYFKGMDVVKQLLDDMSSLKMNIFHWHLTDDQGWRIQIDKYPLLTEVGSKRDSTQIGNWSSSKYDGTPHAGFYTKDQVREILKYAEQRHITVVPEIEMPGHSSAAIAAYPWLGSGKNQITVPCRFGVSEDVYDISKPEVVNFLYDVIDEVAELFPSKVFHIGGDEVMYQHWLSSPTIMKYMKSNNINDPAALQVNFTNNVSNKLSKIGKRMMGWNEITGDKIHDYQKSKSIAESNQELSKDAIVHFWRFEQNLMEKSAKNGYDIVNSNNNYTYIDYSYEGIPLSKAYSFSPIPENFPEELKSKIIGSGCQMWGEWIPNVDAMNEKVYPRIAAYAECGWTNSTNKDYDNFKVRLQPIVDQWVSEGKKVGPID
ncbi:MAG: beta-N-acetylhexosaminidase [Bacteroidales bacterium]|nr:beta-N-acetylhexosaminidase [Bacteroidales bacterium]